MAPAEPEATGPGEPGPGDRPADAVTPRPSPSEPADAATPTPSPSEPAASGMRRGYARSEQRNAAIRDTLRPLAPGERPASLVVAAAVAVALGGVNLVALLAGAEVDGSKPVGAALVFAAVMLVAAVGLWQRRYWAVLGFECLLALIVMFFSLFLLRASNLAAVALCVGVVAAAGWLFWKLIRVMGRLQAPRERVS